MSDLFTDNTVTKYIERKLTCSSDFTPVCSGKGTHKDYPINIPLINKKYDDAILSHTFDKFLDHEDDYEFVTNDKLDYTIKKLGGGASGAYVFLSTDASENTSIIKMYFTALETLEKDGENSAFMIRDDRPFREARSLELLSRYMQEHQSLAPGMFTSLLDVPQILPFKAVERLFYIDPLKIFDPEPGEMTKAKGQTQNDARNFDQKAFFPSHVLAVHMQMAGPGKATELMNISVKDKMYGGAVAQLIVVYFDHFLEVFPKGCHWDLHTENIFVDRSCLVRNSLPLDHLYKKSDGGDLIYDDPDLSGEERDSITEKLGSMATSERYLINVPFGLSGQKRSRFSDNTERIVSRGTRNATTDTARWLEKLTEPVKPQMTEVSYPAVTIIDFDFVTYDTDTMRTPTRDHMKKLALYGGLSERTLTWLLQQLPRSSVFVMRNFLETMKPKFPQSNASDWCHLLSYVFAFSVYSISSVWGKACDFATDEFIQKALTVEKWDKQSLLNLFIPTDSGRSIYTFNQLITNASMLRETLEGTIFATRHEALDKNRRDILMYFEMLTGVPLETWVSLADAVLSGLFGVDVELYKFRDLVSKLLLLPDFTSYENVMFRISIEAVLKKVIGTKDQIISKLELSDSSRLLIDLLKPIVGTPKISCEINIKHIDLKPLLNKTFIMTLVNQNKKDLISFDGGDTNFAAGVERIEVHIGATIEVFLKIGNVKGNRFWEAILSSARYLFGTFRISGNVPVNSLKTGSVISYVLKDDNSPNPLIGIKDGSPEAFLDVISFLKGGCLGQWTKYLTPQMKELVKEIGSAIVNAEVSILPVRTAVAPSDKDERTRLLFTKIKLVERGPSMEGVARIGKPGINELFGYLNLVGFKMPEVLPVIYMLGANQRRGTDAAVVQEKAQNLKDILERYAQKKFRSERWGTYMSLKKAETEILYIADKFFSMSKEALSKALSKDLENNYTRCAKMFTLQRP